jgi:putative transposase
MEPMPKHLDGPTVFFTVSLARPGTRLLIDEIALLREAVRRVRTRRFFHIDAWTVLPDHMHTIWTLPAADPNYSERWGAIKACFSQHLGLAGRAPEPPPGRLSPKARQRGEVGIWQKRFSETVLKDRASYDRHLAFCWTDPIRHGLVERAEAWPHSSLNRDLRLDAGRVASTLKAHVGGSRNPGQMALPLLSEVAA